MNTMARYAATYVLPWLTSISLSTAFGGEAPSYHRDVAPILQKHCQDCHRPGQVAPFALLTYEQARKRTSDIVSVTGDGTMPPWHASTSAGGPFRDARILAETERKTLAAWATANCPRRRPERRTPG